MPKRPKSPCKQPGCPNVSDGPYCEAHAKANPDRPSAASRGYDSRWRKARKVYLQRHPLCVRCEQAGRVVPGTVVDHKIPHRGQRSLFWDEDNWQTLCKPCHDRKTRLEDQRPVY